LIDYCVRPKRTTAEVLADFFSVRFPLEYLLDIIPAIKARQFSISSSLKVHCRQLFFVCRVLALSSQPAGQVHAGRVHMSVAVVNYRTKLKKIRRGLCTAYLASLTPSPQVPSLALRVCCGMSTNRC
jgi:sulfite reductase alpha subunit-like flavoprotein